MSLIPTFDLGIWNAWILSFVFILLRIVPSKKVSRKTEGKVNILINGILFLLLTYSIFLPILIGTLWFYTGIGIFLSGAVLFKITEVAWSTTLEHEPVTKGLYRYSRHPYYFAMFVQLIGIGLASASVVYLLTLIILIVPLNILMGLEEAFCLKTYGETYRKYLSRTSRWIGIPKSA